MTNTPEIIKEQVRRLNSDLLIKKRVLKLAKERRDEILDKNQDYSPILDKFRGAKLERDVFKSQFERNDVDYQKAVETVKDKQFEVREIEKAVSELLSEYLSQTGEFKIPNMLGEWAIFKVKCLFPAKQLSLFAN